MHTITFGSVNIPCQKQGVIGENRQFTMNIRFSYFLCTPTTLLAQVCAPVLCRAPRAHNHFLTSYKDVILCVK